MSAEVAIIKNDCVVLAADSAVTIGTKHYNTSHKLFQLAEPLPVGVMLFGNGGVCGVDLVMLLKMFRQQLPRTPLSRLKGYPDAFVAFLQEHVQELFPALLQQRGLKQDADRWTQCFLEKKLVQEVNFHDGERYDAKKEFLGKEEIKRLTKAYVSREISSRRKDPGCWNIGPSKGKWVKRHVEGQIVESVKEYDGDQSLLWDGDDLMGGQESLLVDLFAEDYAKNAERMGSAGVVFAGYGTDDLYPTVLCLMLDGVADGAVKYRYDDDKKYSVSEELLSEETQSLAVARILPFAQADDMVETYIHGVGFGFQEYILDAVEGKLVEAKLPKGKIASMRKSIDEEILGYSRHNYWYPLIGNIAHLPADETAQLAELLIKLTSFRQHVADEAEEVAEPIDVAMISKGDGFVWYKRKPGLVQP